MILSAGVGLGLHAPHLASLPSPNFFEIQGGDNASLAAGEPFISFSEFLLYLDKVCIV
jgi:hypothetical protein